MPTGYKNTPERFWRNVDRSAGKDACWPWTLSRIKDKYGQAHYQGKVWPAHRLAFVLAGNNVGDLFVCHTCDNPICCNPKHLFAGTPADNMMDKVNKGRQAKGEQHSAVMRRVANPLTHEKSPKAKLSACDVLEIRRLSPEMTQRELGRKYGVHHATIGKILRGESWK